MHRCCGLRWRAPSGHPTPVASGIGRLLTMRVKPRPSCSSASSVPPCAGGPRRPPSCCRCSPKSRACFPPTHAARKRARRFSSFRRRSALASWPALPARSCPPTLCWSLRPAHPYREWIAEYAGEAYQGVAAAARRHLDDLAARAMTERRFTELAALFGKASRLEADFWQMGLDAAAR